MKKLFYCGILIATIMACNAGPEPINYGSDACAYCHMTIVDKQHAAEIVTKKGRVSTFDAIECMMNYRKTIDQSDVALFLINDYNIPGELISATTATYLISENIQSPMGANLSGTAQNEDAKKLQKEHGGTLYRWDELIKYFKDTRGILKE